MLIDDRSLHIFLDARLTEISRALLQEHIVPCPHCHHAIQLPVVARKQDIDDFKSLLASAYRVMDKHGITANLLADITAECHIEIARRKSKRKGHEQS